MSDRYDNLSFRMIFTLKLEVRVVVRSHIMGILKASYAFEVESNTTIIEADGFLHELHAHLLAIDQILLSHVSLPVRMFVYDGLQGRIHHLCIQALGVRLTGKPDHCVLCLLNLIRRFTP